MGATDEKEDTLVDTHCSLSRERERERGEENSGGRASFLASVRSLPLVVESGGRHFCEDRTKEQEDGVAVDEIPMIGGARPTLEIFLTVRIRLDICCDR